MDDMQQLACHSASRTTAVRSVEAAVRRGTVGELALRFVLRGDMSRIELPPLRAVQREDGLWRHTCFECFIRANGSAYLEFNFSPSRAWAGYAFRGYREPAAAPADFDPCVAIAYGSDALELRATIATAALASLEAREPWHVGLTAVVEEATGAITYWALRHAPGKPDFHHADTFALEL
ncbi:MAG: DOMON-like domain-containing protein [Rhodospirillaceae bacterium]